MHFVREFAELAFKYVGIEVKMTGQGIEEKGVNKAIGEHIVEVDPKYFRPERLDNYWGILLIKKC
ncbi:GDP-mannose 4,6-dehydratase [Bacillus sp. Y1]